MRPLRLLFAATFAVQFLAVAPLLAAGSEAGGVNEPIGWVFRWLNFALVFGGAGYLILRKGPAFFRGHAAAIVASIGEAARAKEEADRRLREAEEKLARLDQEVAELRAAARREAEAEAERIRSAARDEAGKTESAGMAELEAAARAARMELKAMAARLAVERAEAIIRRQISPEAHSSIFRFFLDNLARSAS